LAFFLHRDPTINRLSQVEDGVLKLLALGGYTLVACGPFSVPVDWR